MLARNQRESEEMPKLDPAPRFDDVYERGLENMNKIEYRIPSLKPEMEKSFGLDFEDYAQSMLGEYGLHDFTLMVCPQKAKFGEQAFGQLPLRCGGLASKNPCFKRIWLSVHYSRVEMILTLYHEIHHILYPQLSEEDIIWLEENWGGYKTSPTDYLVKERENEKINSQHQS